MEISVTYLVILALVKICLIGVTYFFYKGTKKPEGNQQRQRAAPRPRDGAPRRAQLARNRGIRLRANAVNQEEEDDDEGAPEPAVEFPEGKIGAKKRAKLEAKAEKKAQREAEEQSRAERKKREQVAEEERKRAEEKEKAEERKRLEEEKRAKDEKEKREHEEYLKMKEAFMVEAEGYEEGEEENQNMLQEFVNYIKTSKVVVIEDLAAKFKLKTQAAIDRIKDLQNDAILTGVIDDRGKYIYVSQEEMEAFAKFIRQRGRVSIEELVEHSNQLLRM